MNIESTKIDLMQQLLKTDDEKVLLKIRKVFEENASDWYDDLSLEEKKEIEKGLQDAENKRLISHQSVIDKFKKWH